MIRSKNYEPFSCVQIKNVTKRFGEDLVLKEVNLSLNYGQVYGIVGNNGSGKTVLMKCICGFLPVTTGTIHVFGRQIGQETDFPESLGVIIETPGFLTQYTGMRNLEILADMNRIITKADIRLILRKVGLNPDMKKPVGKYSLGMRQRLGIAQAIMEDPRFLILDEPFNGLDKHGVEEIRALLLELKAMGKTILLASHNEEDIRILCDHVYEMDGGVLRERNPQLLLEDSNLSNQNLKAGTTREMSVTFRNKSRSQNVYGLKISLSTETKGICFDRNSFYVQRLTPGEAITLKQNISIEEDTAPGQVTVTFSLEYEDSRATSATGTETLTFNVTQPVCAELEVSDIPSVFYAMDTVEVSVKAMNLGRDKIYNAKVQMNADGLNPNETVFLGNVDAGNSAEGTIRIYVKEGAQGDAGKFTLTYEDSSGSSYESSTDFTYQIKDTQIQSLKVDDEQEETNGWWYSLIAVVAILLISIILLLIARLHKKNILLEEARKAAFH